MQSINAINGACNNTSNCQPDCIEADFISKQVNLVNLYLPPKWLLSV